VWSVEFANETVEKEVASLIRARKLSRSDQIVIHAWIRQITYHGPESVRGDSKWADHALVDEWEGYRSTAFSNRGRIIYRIVENKILIQIARITNEHDYLKKTKGRSR
jgi:mRNA-degrading endonuclease YafQ of YafQ-DinJ toxin-antitoxin module